MRGNSENGDGPGDELPWASVFDSAANMRALSAIQSEGFRAASSLVDRFVRVATRGLDGRAATSEPLSRDQRADLFGATDIEPLLRSWWALAGQLLLGADPRVADPAEVRPAAALDVSTADAKGGVTLDVVRPSKATTEVWLHNTGATDLGTTRLRCSDLLADDGSVVASSAVTFDSADIPMPGRSSRGIDMSIDVDQEIKPGLYRGTLLAEGHPDLWLPVVLTVRAAAE
jgi:hypothetical protein